MTRRSLVPALLALALLPVSGGGQVHRSAQHDFTLAPVADGLVNPWSMAWLPDGTMLITERPGRLRVVRDGMLLPEAADRVLAVDEALGKLAREKPPVARLVELRYFAGLTQEQVAETAGISLRTAERHWTWAKAWLFQRIRARDQAEPPA